MQEERIFTILVEHCTFFDRNLNASFSVVFQIIFYKTFFALVAVHKISSLLKVWQWGGGGGGGDRYL